MSSRGGRPDGGPPDGGLGGRVRLPGRLIWVQLDPQRLSGLAVAGLAGVGAAIVILAAPGRRVNTRAPG